MLAGLKTVGEVLLSAVAPMFKEVILILKTRRIAFRTEVKAIGHSATLGVGAQGAVFKNSWYSDIDFVLRGLCYL